MNRRVDLIGEDDEVVDSVYTDSQGNYDFGLVQIGEHEVQPSIPRGWQSTTEPTADVQVTRGQYFTDVDFGVRPARGPVQSSTDCVFAREFIGTTTRPLIDDLLA